LRRVLIVDDDQAIVNLLVELIGGEGHDARAVPNDEAVAVARAWQPHVIVLDLMMPEPDGFAISRMLEADPATRAIPVIAMSAAYPASRVQDRIRATHFLPKPFDIFEILTLVEEVGAEPRAGTGPHPTPLSPSPPHHGPATTYHDRGL
jgi:CheY-like chemotaxis protein